jgi:hypothetical protein
MFKEHTKEADMVVAKRPFKENPNADLNDRGLSKEEVEYAFKNANYPSANRGKRLTPEEFAERMEKVLNAQGRPIEIINNGTIDYTAFSKAALIFAQDSMSDGRKANDINGLGNLEKGIRQDWNFLVNRVNENLRRIENKRSEGEAQDPAELVAGMNLPKVKGGEEVSSGTVVPSETPAKVAIKETVQSKI